LNKSLKGLLHPLALFHPQFTLTNETRKLRLVECDFDTYVKETSFSDRRTRQMLKRKGACKFKKATIPEVRLEALSASILASRMDIESSPGGGQDVEPLSPAQRSEGQASLAFESSSPTARMAGEDLQWPISRDEGLGEHDWQRSSSLEKSLDSRLSELDGGNHLEDNVQNEDTIEVQLNRELVRVNNVMEGHLGRVVQELRDLQMVSASLMKSMQRDVAGDAIGSIGAPMPPIRQSFSGLMPETSARQATPRIDHREAGFFESGGCSPSFCRL